MSLILKYEAEVINTTAKDSLPLTKSGSIDHAHGLWWQQRPQTSAGSQVSTYTTNFNMVSVDTIDYAISCHYKNAEDRGHVFLNSLPLNISGYILGEGSFALLFEIQFHSATQVGLSTCPSCQSPLSIGIAGVHPIPS